MLSKVTRGMIGPMPGVLRQAHRKWTLRVNNKLIVTVGVGLALLSGVLAEQGYCAGSALPPHLITIQDGFRYGFPPHIEKRGLTFAGQSVPLARRDVRKRILKEINYFLQDKRALLLVWLSRADSLKHVVSPILKQYRAAGRFRLSRGD